MTAFDALLEDHEHYAPAEAYIYILCIFINMICVYIMPWNCSS